MESAESAFRDRRPRSEELFERARRVMPGGVSHTVRNYPPYPAFIQRAEGSRIWDVDGNEYIDLWLGHYTHILGHAPPCVVEALRRALADGLNWGHVNAYEVELAELICQLVPSAEMVRFCCSGTEATMFVVRLARAYTGKRMILKVQGSWHGPSTDLSVAIRHPFDAAESTGIPPELLQFTATIPFNEPDAALQIIERHQHDLAAIILDPIIGAGAFMPASRQYLTALRDAAQACGALLIFDEVITGFRAALGGSQEALGFTPDLTTLGKIVGGGMPIGVVCGRADILERSAATYSPGKGTTPLLGGGTFSAFHLTMIGGLSMLRYLREHAATLYPRLAANGDYVRRGIEQAMRSAGIATQCTGYGSLFGVNFPKEPNLILDTPLKLHRQTYNAQYEDELKIRLMNHGLYAVHGAGALSAAHSDADLDAIIEAYGMAAHEMVESTRR